jgi:hypothetical protein
MRNLLVNETIGIFESEMNNNMSNKIFISLVVLAVGVLVGWFYFKGKTVTTPFTQTVQTTPTPAGSNLGPPEDISGVSGNGLEKGGVQR